LNSTIKELIAKSLINKNLNEKITHSEQESSMQTVDQMQR